VGSSAPSARDAAFSGRPPGYGLPFDVVGRRHAKVHVRFEYDDQSDPGPYPFDARTPIEGGSDRHALIVQRGTCRP
jgi:hypothetical protein